MNHVQQYYGYFFPGLKIVRGQVEKGPPARGPHPLPALTLSHVSEFCLLQRQLHGANCSSCCLDRCNVDAWDQAKHHWGPNPGPLSKGYDF